MNRESRREKDLKNTYLQVARETVYGEDFEENLLYGCQVPGLLRFYELHENGEEFLVYELDHRLSCAEQLEGKRMNCEWMAAWIHSFVRTLESVDEYLLDPSNLVLEMAYIFGSDGQWEYVYIPGYGEDFWKQMERLGEEWLNYVDYKDERAVLWAYTFYQKVHRANCGIGDLLEILETEQKRPEGKGGTVKKEIPRINEERTGWREGLRQLLERQKEKLFKIGRRERADINDFYDKEHPLANTCPVFEDLHGLFPEKEEPGKKGMVLIPVGENELPVIPIKKFPFLLGRAPEEVDRCFDKNQISRVHARIENRGNEIFVVDMNSANGTFRNDESLKPGSEYVLHTGDILKLADLEFICQ